MRHLQITLFINKGTCRNDRNQKKLKAQFPSFVLTYMKLVISRHMGSLIMISIGCGLI